MSDERYICIHGHFYQPPRENPWLERVEYQQSAQPYHDWNERITAECYQPNATSRILDENGRIAGISNNYAQMSFNFGPTLLSWLEEHARNTYEGVLAGDRESRLRFSGHGSALAQVYNHVIMPLANARDKETQILWGIRDFEHRFGRRPEGMWLAETAVDTETLEALARHGVAFTVLAPRQAAAVRRIGEDAWQEVNGTRIDPARAYRCRLPSGAAIDLFFYDGPVARSVAFDNLLDSGEAFAGRLAGAFSNDRHWPQLVHVATDGETYGHHHRFGDMALAYALRYIEEKKIARLTNYGEYLEKHPPEYEVRIVENSSWSCIHGVERWRADCGCNTGGHGGWNQAWRAPLREALDWLRDEAATLYEKEGAELFEDPWRTRDDYISVILNRNAVAVDAFCKKHLKTGGRRSVHVLKLLEMQRHAMLMFTSCGWFFDDVSDISTVQILQYAGRVIQLVDELFEKNLEPGFLQRLEGAASNLPEYGDGRRLYERFVRPAALDLVRVGAHYAVSSLFQAYDRKTQIYCFDADLDTFETAQTGKTSMAVGRVRLTSRITGETSLISFGAIHLGDQVLYCGVRPFISEQEFRDLRREVGEAFHISDFADVIRLLDKHFGRSIYSLKDLFRREQRQIVHRIMEPTLQGIENAYRHIFEEHAAMMRFLPHIGVSLPRSFQNAAEYIINLDLRREFLSEDPSPGRVEAIMRQVDELKVGLETELLEFALRGTLESSMAKLRAKPDDVGHMERMFNLMQVVERLPFPVKLWTVQNDYDALRRLELSARARRAGQEDIEAGRWVARFRELGERLGFSEAALEAAPGER